MKKRTFQLILAFFFVVPLVIMTIKIGVYDYALERTLSKTSFQVRLNYQFPNAADSAHLRVFLPASGERQSIHSESNRSDGFDLLIQKGNNGRFASWNGNALNQQVVSYGFEFLGYGLQYNIDPEVRVHQFMPPVVAQYLEGAGTPDQLYREVEDTLALQSPFLLANLEAMFATARKKGVDEARHLIRMCRMRGIPARFAGGLDLDHPDHEYRGWAEVFVQGDWIPFDPAKGHFARIPASYLQVYNGYDMAPRHNANTGFQHWVEVKQRTTINPVLLSDLAGLPLNAFAIWSAFEQAGIPLDILKVILLLPLGALIVALFRNVIGLSTFGIFLPALIAMASKETGFLWGAIAFLLVIGVVSLIHIPMERWGLLSVPKMTIMLVTVVAVFVTVSLIGVKGGVQQLAYIALFPIVVVAISAERFAKTVIEEDLFTALRLTLQTLLVAGVAYLVMNSGTVESLFLAFPELFMVIIGINLILGRWIGLRLTELFRFNWIIR